MFVNDFLLGISLTLSVFIKPREKNVKKKKIYLIMLLLFLINFLDLYSSRYWWNLQAKYKKKKPTRICKWKMPAVVQEI
jgi:hypothetical protein